ncbi:MAG: diguanylate cyclase [Aestuariibacter sp.]
MQLNPQPLTVTSHSQTKILILLFVVILLGLSLRSATADVIIHPKSNDPKETLVLEILKLAIQHSDKADQFRYQEFENSLTEARMVEMVKEHKLSIMWAGTQIKYEQELMPIRFPVLKGMLGHRIFIIRQDDQPRFNGVNSLAQLQQIPLGQGRFWGDTVVLKHANLPVVTPVKYASLFYMLEGGRFDYFPRAIHEPWSEVASRKELALTVEKRILIVYPFAMYFFVARENSELAATIAQGFRRAIDNEKYDELFFAHPMIKDALSRANLKDRIVFHLDNPNMSPETPVDDASLWLNIDDL